MPPTAARQSRTSRSVPVRCGNDEWAQLQQAAHITGTTASQLMRTGGLLEAHRIIAQRAAAERAIERAAEKAAAERAGQ